MADYPSNFTPKQRALMMMQQQRQHFEQKAKEEAEYKSEMDKKYPRQQQSFEQWKAMRAKNAEPVHLAIGGQGPKNWMKGGVDRILNSLKQRTAVGDDPAETLAEMQRVWHPEAIEKAAKTVPTVRETIPRQMQELEHKAHLNNWIQSNLGNYIRKQMGTHNDPIRALAEQGILHVSPDQVGIDRWKAEHHRANWDAPKLGKSEHAQAWEDATDVAMKPNYVSHLEGSRREPWMDKVDPSTKVFAPTNSMDANALGFDHIIDILKQDLAEGRIRPDQLNKVSIEQAVRRAHEYNEERKKKMAETALKATEGMPVHKDYGNGFRWLELALDKNLPEGWTSKKLSSGDETYYDPQGERHVHPNMEKLAEALKYEGDTMGHCVGNYCPAVANGSTRIFSLRDKKNEPHITVETKPASETDYDLAINKLSGKDLENFIVEHQQQMLKNNMNATPAAREAYKKLYGALPDMINQIKGKGNAKPVAKYIPYAQDFVKSGNWSQVNDAHNTNMRRYSDVFNDNEQRAIENTNEHVPNHEWLTGEDIQRLHNAITPPGKRLKYDSNGKIVGHEGEYKRGGIIHKAGGGATEGKPMNTPNLAQMRLHLTQRKNPDFMSNIGLNEALNISPAPFINPDPRGKNVPQVGGVAQNDGLPIGGTDENGQKPGMQLAPPAPPAPPAPQQPGQQGQQPPQGGGGSGPTPPMGNMLQMTPQGQAMSAMKPAGMAKGGSAKSLKYEETNNPTRVLIRAGGYGGVNGIVVPRHMLEGKSWTDKKSGKPRKIEGLNDINEARAQVYGAENRDPLTIGQVGKLHRKILAEHFAKPLPEQVAAEKEALERLRAAKHIGKTADTLDESEKLDTVRHEYGENGKPFVGFASKGVAGHAVYSSGHGENQKFHVLNTCPGQTTGCGGGVDANGIVDTSKGTCFAPNAESQYPAASVRRAAHEQAKHDPAMSPDWILAHTGSLRRAAENADKKDLNLLFRPNVVDETDVSSRNVIKGLNKQRKAEGKPMIIANSYGKTNELHDPENGYFVTHSNVGPKTKLGQEIAENIARDKQRVRSTISNTDASGRDIVNDEGDKTPPKNSYMVTDVKRNSPLSREMQKHIKYAKYWGAPREEGELSEDERNEGPEGHFDAHGKPTSEDKAHFGHITFEGKRFDYQKQHILHPRLVQVGVNDDGTPHLIPTDSRFKDNEYLPKKRFMTKNGKEAGAILMTTPTESTSNLGHQTSFTHHVNQRHVDYAKDNGGEYEIDSPLQQILAAGKEYQAPQPIQILKKGKKKFAMGGHVSGMSDTDLNDDDAHAFPEQNFAAQHHLAKRIGVESEQEIDPEQLYGNKVA